MTSRKGQKTAGTSAKNRASGRALSEGDPRSRGDAPRDGSHPLARVSNAGDPAIPVDIPSFLAPTPISSDIPPVSTDEDTPDPGAGQFFSDFRPKVGGSHGWDAVRVPALKNVGRDADGKVIPHERSEETAQKVAELALIHPENTICAILNIRPGHLREHYYNELMHSRAVVDARVASTAYALALSGDVPHMTKFVAKARLKWKDGEDNGAAASLFSNIHIHVEQ